MNLSEETGLETGGSLANNLLGQCHLCKRMDCHVSYYVLLILSRFIISAYSIINTSLVYIMNFIDFMFTNDYKVKPSHISQRYQTMNAALIHGIRLYIQRGFREGAYL